jgi:MSHA biogenesis protein MshJ
MSSAFKRYADRLDALTERERIAVALAGGAAVVFVFHLLFIGPDLDQRRLLDARMADQDKQIAAAQAQQEELLRTLQRDPDAAVRVRMEEKQRQIAELDSQLAGLQRTLIAPDRMPVVLRQLVGQGRGVRLMSLRNLPAVPIGQGNTAEAGKAEPTKAQPPKADAGAGEHGVYKHGVEIVVQGSYFDLLDYVDRLEKQPWQVYWGKTVLAAEYPKVVVTLTLYTLSLDKSWLVV